MENCEVTIKQTIDGTTRAVRYQFDDRRIALALETILDSVGELHDEGAYQEWSHIYKEIPEYLHTEPEDCQYKDLKQKGGSVYGKVCEKENQDI